MYETIHNSVVTEDDLLKAGSTIWIPTSPNNNEGIFFTKGQDNWITNRNKTIYDRCLFPEEFILKSAQKISKNEVSVSVIKTPNDTRTLEGWSREDFFGPNRVVVDLGSGQAIALLEYSQEFPQTIFIGIDTNYSCSKPVNLTQTGVQLVKDNWDILDSIPPNSVDTILSVQGGLTWSCEGPKFDRTGNPESFVRAISKIAKDGCVFLSDSIYSADIKSRPFPLNIKEFQEKNLLKQFKKSGWDRIVLNQTAFFIFNKTK